MDFGRMKGPVLKWGGIAGIVFGIVLGILAFGSIIPFVNLLVGLIGIGLFFLSGILDLVLGFFAAKKAGDKELGGSVVAGALGAFVFTMVAGIIQLIATVIAGILGVGAGVALGAPLMDMLFFAGATVLGGIITLFFLSIGGAVIGAIGGAINSLIK